MTGVELENGHGPEELGARLVVGADGRHSRVARSLDLLHEHPWLRKFAVRGYWIMARRKARARSRRERARKALMLVPHATALRRRALRRRSRRDPK